MNNSISRNESGIVLVMVLLILVATIIIGVAVFRSSFFGTRIVGNERLYQDEFYETESAGDYIISEFDDIFSDLSLVVDSSYSLTNELPSGLFDSNLSITITLTKKNASAPVGSGMGVGSTACNYYTQESQNTNQSVTMGLWKVFAKQD